VLSRPEPATGLPPPVASINDIRHCFEFRLSVEGEGAYYAALRAGDTDLAAIADALAAFDAVMPAGAPAIAEDFDFHLAIARASGNPFILNALRTLVQQIRFGMNLSGNLAGQRSEERLRLIRSEHVRVYDAIRARTPGAARDALRSHIATTWHRLFGSDDLTAG
jgi:GntR family transcriptional repressor for pyruvate dehydrogenase complex